MHPLAFLFRSPLPPVLALALCWGRVVDVGSLLDVVVVVECSIQFSSSNLHLYLQLLRLCVLRHFPR